MIFFPEAKINIGLRIGCKRPDGYHDIETIFYPVGLSDALEFVISESLSDEDNLIVSGIDPGGESGNNLVMKAVIKLREEKHFPCLNIHLHKAIPVGAGLGGGSSDAAGILRVLNRHFKLGLDNDKLKVMALELGSDCPFFIDSLPSVATGRGEILSPVKPLLSGYYMVLVNPGIGISTAEAYKNCTVTSDMNNLAQLFERPVTDWKGLLINDFEEYAFRKHPVIGKLKEDFYRSGAIFSLMSGSGSSVYGIFNTKPELNPKLREFVIWEGKL